jgi:hypothetical protein
MGINPVDLSKEGTSPQHRAVVLKNLLQMSLVFNAQISKMPRIICGDFKGSTQNKTLFLMYSYSIENDSRAAFGWLLCFLSNLIRDVDDHGVIVAPSPSDSVPSLRQRAGNDRTEGQQTGEAIQGHE